MTKQYTFYYNSAVCTGCKACVIACKDKHDLPVGQSWRRVYEVDGGDWVQQGDTWTQNAFAYYLSISCNHCENPQCAEVCPTTATHVAEDGSVQIDTSKCVGCRYCTYACPYGAPQFREEQGVMGKCTGCQDYVSQGEKPACVSACPSRALDFGEKAELEKKYGPFSAGELAPAVYPLPDPAMTNPSLILVPHRNAKQGQSVQLFFANPEEV